MIYFFSLLGSSPVSGFDVLFCCTFPCFLYLNPNGTMYIGFPNLLIFDYSRVGVDDFVCCFSSQLCSQLFVLVTLRTVTLVLHVILTASVTVPESRVFSGIWIVYLATF